MFSSDSAWNSPGGGGHGAPGAARHGLDSGLELRTLLVSLKERLETLKDRLARRWVGLEDRFSSMFNDFQLMSMSTSSVVFTGFCRGFDAGDHTAQEEIASERELCDFWEKRAKGSEELVNQLLAQRKRMRQEKSDMIHRLEKELKMHQRRAQGRKWREERRGNGTNMNLKLNLKLIEID